MGDYAITKGKGKFHEPACITRTTRKLLFSDYDQDFAASEIFDLTGPPEQAVTNAPHAIAISGISRAMKRDVRILELDGKYPS